MAGLNISHSTSQPIATGAGSRKTILEYTAPANTGARVRRITVTGDGISPTAAKGDVHVVKGATTGTGTNRAPLKVHGHTGSVQGTGKENFTVEPTGGLVVDKANVHPQLGHVFHGPKGEGYLLAPGETISVSANFAATVNLHVVSDIEE